MHLIQHTIINDHFIYLVQLSAVHYYIPFFKFIILHIIVKIEECIICRNKSYSLHAVCVAFCAQLKVISKIKKCKRSNSFNTF